MTSYLCNRKFFFSTTTVENLKRFGKELTNLLTDTPNEKEIICIYLAIDPKGQGDLQDHFGVLNDTIDYPDLCYQIVAQYNVT